MASHFSRTIVRQLSRKGITLCGGRACAAFEGDEFFSGYAYGLEKDGVHYLRSYSEVVAIAEGRLELALAD